MKERQGNNGGRDEEEENKLKKGLKVKKINIRNNFLLLHQGPLY